MRSHPTPVRVIVLVIALTCGASGSSGAATCGDSDGSGSVTVTDGVNVLRQAADLSSSCSNNPSRCDTDGNGSVTVTDGVNVLRSAAGLSASLSCPNEDAVGRFAGHYEGTFSGGDDGTFDVDLDCDGVIDGSGYSSFFDEDFDISGKANRDGDVTFTVGGTSSGSKFEGVLGEGGGVSGQWSNRVEGTNGTFHGQRTSQRSCS